jgi:hypothetical protein
MSQSFSFKVATESSKVKRTNTGIHDFKVADVTKELIPGKNGKEDWYKVVVLFEVEKTIQGDPCVGSQINYDITMPNTQAAFDFTSASQLHIFSKTTTSANVEKLKEAIKKFEVGSIDDYLKLFIQFKGKKVRLVVTGDSKKENGTWNYIGAFSTIPMFAGGVAETIDSNTAEDGKYNGTLTYDEKKQGLVKEPKNAEIPTRTDVPNWSVPSTTEVTPVEGSIDSLPF